MSPHELEIDASMNDEDEPALIAADEGDEVPQDEDARMDSDSDQDSTSELQLRNDSIAHFDAHSDSIFCIAQHPLHSHIVATGAGDDTAQIFSISSAQKSGLSNSAASLQERESLPSISTLTGHTDSINDLAFSLPEGDILWSAGLDGQLSTWKDTSAAKDGSAWALLARIREVDEINFVKPCPHVSYPNTVALGASDGSIWLYTVDSSDSGSPLKFVNAFYLHTAAVTAGAWSSNGSLLATVSEDGSLYVWDAFGDAAAAGVGQSQGGQYVVGLTAEDERFRVEGGLYSVAVSPNSAYAAVGGAEGHIRIVGLPRLTEMNGSTTDGTKGGAGPRPKAGGRKQAGGAKRNESSVGQSGQVLATMQAQSDGVETLKFSPNSNIPLLAAGSVDGSIVLFDTKSNFAIRKHIQRAHEDQAVIQLDFVGSEGAQAWILTSCGNDGVLRRWDVKGGARTSSTDLLGEYKGHRGGGDGGGILGFVQGGDAGRYVVTAGDE